MIQKHEVFYNSTVRGLEENLNGGEVVYYGKTFTTSESEYGSEKQQESLSKQMGEVQLLIDELPPDLMLGGIIELYEVWEPETGNVISFWRVPVRKKSLPGSKNKLLI